MAKDYRPSCCRYCCCLCSQQLCEYKSSRSKQCGQHNKLYHHHNKQPNECDGDE